MKILVREPYGAAGAFLVFCDHTHAMRWTAAQPPGAVRTFLDRVRYREAPVDACTHCAWCGALVSEPGDGLDECVLHGYYSCPSWQLLGTTRSLELGERVAERTGCAMAQLPDTFWRFAQNASLSMTFPDAAALAEFCWAGRRYWAPHTVG